MVTVVDVIAGIIVSLFVFAIFCFKNVRDREDFLCALFGVFPIFFSICMLCCIFL